MRKTVLPAVAALLFAVGAAGQVVLAHSRAGTRSSMDEGVLAALGGFRSLAAEVVWYRLDRLQEEGRFGELVQLASILTWLEPHDSEVWAYSAWNLAYNVSVRMPREEDRWPWVREAIRLLRDEGLRWNPADAALYRELAFMYELKIGVDDNDTAAHIYRGEWKKIVEDVAARDAWGEIGMDRSVMTAVEKRYGVTDWTNPFATAVYFAHCGLACGDERQNPFLNTILKQSVRMYHEGPARRGEAK